MVELPDVDDVVFVFHDGSFVVVSIQIVGSTEQCNQRRKTCFLVSSVHTVASILSFMRTNH